MAEDIKIPTENTEKLMKEMMGTITEREEIAMELQEIDCELADMVEDLYVEIGGMNKNPTKEFAQVERFEPKIRLTTKEKEGRSRYRIFVPIVPGRNHFVLLVFIPTQGWRKDDGHRYLSSIIERLKNGKASAIEVELIKSFLENLPEILKSYAKKLKKIDKKLSDTKIS